VGLALRGRNWIGYMTGKFERRPLLHNISLPSHTNKSQNTPIFRNTSDTITHNVVDYR